jgi:hypothetical protein
MYDTCLIDFCPARGFGMAQFPPSAGRHVAMRVGSGLGSGLTLWIVNFYRPRADAIF